MNPFAKEALRLLEQAEDMLHRAEAFETHREPVSNARMELGADLMDEAYEDVLDATEVQDE